MIAFEMQNEANILRPLSCQQLQGNANLNTKVLFDISKCAPVLIGERAAGCHLLYSAPTIRTHPAISLITSLSHKA